MQPSIFFNFQVVKTMLSSICTRHHHWPRSSSRALTLARKSALLSQHPSECRNTTTSTTSTTTMSATKEFKSIPVEPTILKYIDMIGVGRINIANLKSKRNLQRRKRTAGSNNLMSEAEENEFFKDQALRNRLQRDRRPVSKVSTSSWLPPPPFGATFHSQGERDSDGNKR